MHSKSYEVTLNRVLLTSWDRQCVPVGRRADHRCANRLVKMIFSVRTLMLSSHGGDIIIVTTLVNDKQEVLSVSNAYLAQASLDALCDTEDTPLT